MGGLECSATGERRRVDASFALEAPTLRSSNATTAQYSSTSHRSLMLRDAPFSATVLLHSAIFDIVSLRLGLVYSALVVPSGSLNVQP